MKKKLLFFITVFIVAMLALTIAACTDYTDPDDEESAADTVTRNQVITNGTFYNASASKSDDYLKQTVTGWTATKGSLATNLTGVTVGVIDIGNETAFNGYKGNLFEDGAITNPGVDKETPKDTDDDGVEIDELQDTNVLVIANKNELQGSLYYKNSSSFTLEANSYYLLQYSVATFIDMTGVDEEDEQYKGAWVHVTGGIEYMDSCINTNGEWKTHRLYIETNKFASTSLDIRLWLGHGPATINNKANKYVTKGVAFFDNIICTKVTSVDDDKISDKVSTTALNDKDSLVNHNNFSLMAAAAISAKSPIGYESAYYMTDTKLEQMTEATPTGTPQDFYYSFREGSYSGVNVKNYDSIKGKSGLSTSDQPATTPAFTGIVDLSKLYAEDTKTDTFSALINSVKPNNVSGFLAPSYKAWTEQIMTEDRAALDETKALMIFHKDLLGLGFKSKNTLTVESNKYYKISVYAYVWAPVTEEGNFDFPKGNITEPEKKYTDMQNLFATYYDAKEDATDIFPFKMSFADYTKELTATEEKFIEDQNNGASTTTNIDSKIRAVYNSVFGADEYKEDKFVTTKMYSTYEVQFAWLYAYENLDKVIDQFDENDKVNAENKIKYEYLTSRKKFMSGDWNTYTKLKEEWDSYYDKVAAADVKYNAWSNNNIRPTATVKLTGAGEDIKKTTEKCNEGWEVIEFFIQGNQLSDRKLNLEFWFGEGSATEYENLMFGGVFFDNIDILEVSADKASGYKDSKGNEVTWEALSAITDKRELSFGGLIDEEDTSAHWAKELADKNVMASGDIDKISLKSDEITDAVGSIKIDGQEVKLRQLVYSHTEATASVLTSQSGENHEYDIKIAPNKAYRFAVMVKTEGFEKDKGVTINLMGATEDGDPSSISSVSSYNTDGKWKEIAFYILGDVLETNYLSLKVSIGSGSRFDTSNYLAGTVYLAVPNYVEIKYSEFNASSKSGDEVKTYTFANTATASESVNNGNFASLDYSTTDEKEFDEDGTLVGVGTPSSWSKGTEVTNTYNEVKLTALPKGSSELYNLAWASVKGVDVDGKSTDPKAYEVYARFTEKDKTVERLYAIVNADGINTLGSDNVYNATDDKYSFDIDMTGYRPTSVRVRAVGDNAVGKYSSYEPIGTQNSETGKVLITEAEEVAGKKEIKIGTVNNKDKDLFDTPDYSANEKVAYSSPYDTALMISSNYGVGLGMTASSKTLNSNTYYLISVWVMTVGEDTKASVTVDNVSKVLSADVGENFIGYSGINTAGKWVQYRFYVKTGTSSSTFQLELALGNPYAVKTSQKLGTSSSSSVAVYKDSDLSQGTVYFDAVRVYEIKEDEYEAQGDEYDEEGAVKLYDFEHLYTNQYAIRKLEYTIDSFDSFDENTTASGSDGHNNGHTPNFYNWNHASDATGTSEKYRMYGVYNYKDSDRLSHLYTKDDDDDKKTENLFDGFMKEYLAEGEEFDIAEFVHIDGFNSLVMSNKVAYGQNYTTSTSSTISAGAYYKLSFKAKTLIAGVEEDSDGKTTYHTDDVYAEFRFMQSGASDKYQSILINSYEVQEYTIYIYNPSATSASAKWAFYLGADEDDKDETGSKQLLMGMMVIDQVALATIDKEEYEAQKLVYDDLEGRDKTYSKTIVYSYDEDKKTDDDNEPEPEEPTENEKQSVWDRGDVWLLVSSLVIAVIIIVVVVVVLVRRWKKKHPKEVVGENVAKTDKEIKVQEPASTGKEDIVEDDEYSDVVKPVYVQRVVRKNKKKKKK